MKFPELQIELAGKTIRAPLTSDSLTIGRSSGCDIVLDHPSVSKCHASIERIAEGRWRITDLDSKNGLVVTGVLERRMILTGEEVVLLGEATIKIDLHPRRGSTALRSAVKVALLIAVVAFLYRENFSTTPNSPTPERTSVAPPSTPLPETPETNLEPPPPVPAAVAPALAEIDGEDTVVSEVTDEGRPEVHADLPWVEAVGIYRRLAARAPSAKEFELLRMRGLQEATLAALAGGESWRARARAFVGGGGRVPTELAKLKEAPVDRSLWGEWLARTPASRGAPPLPAGDGSDAQFTSWVASAPAWQPGEVGEPIEQFRSIWVSLLDFAPTIEDEKILAAIIAEGVPVEELVARIGLLIAMSPLSKEVEPLVGEEAAWVEKWCRRLLPGRIEEETRKRWAGEIARGELSPLLTRARWAAAAFPPSPGEGVAVSPRGFARVRIDLLIVDDARVLVSHPNKVPRLWARLPRSHLHLFPEGEEPRGEISRLLEIGQEAAMVEVEGIGERRGDGWLLAGIAELAKRLEVSVGLPLESPADLELLVDLASAGVPVPSTTREGSLFRAGGWRLVPGEWRAPLYMEATRALLVAGAQLKGRPFASISVRTALRSSIVASDRREWEELMTAVALLERQCPDHHIDLWFWGNATEGHSALRVLTGPTIEHGRVHRELVPALAMRRDLKVGIEDRSGEEEGR
ncbi:MAG TPA: FHA domain-containing protein [Planctomycetes bacterium]|nr:FHA domain-containing protein [Planctomycetota bacterium]